MPASSDRSPSHLRCRAARLRARPDPTRRRRSAGGATPTLRHARRHPGRDGVLPSGGRGGRRVRRAGARGRLGAATSTSSSASAATSACSSSATTPRPLVGRAARRHVDDDVVVLPGLARRSRPRPAAGPRLGRPLLAGAISSRPTSSGWPAAAGSSSLDVAVARADRRHAAAGRARRHRRRRTAAPTCATVDARSPRRRSRRRRRRGAAARTSPRWTSPRPTASSAAAPGSTAPTASPARRRRRARSARRWAPRG